MRTERITGAFHRFSLIFMIAAAPGAQASGFALIEHSARGLGVCYADGVAGADDASVLFLNPAGLSRVGRSHATMSITGITIDSQFRDRASRPALGQELGATSTNGGTSAGVPAMFAAVDLGQLAFGIGLFAPFGLATKYDSQWAGRFLARDSEIRSFAANASAALKLRPTLAVGIGVERRRVDARLTNAVNYTAVLASATEAVLGTPVIVPAAEGNAELKGRDDAWGYTAGIDWMPREDIRLGLGYRSSSTLTLRGNATFEAPSLPSPALTALASAVLPSESASLRLKTPSTLAVGAAFAAGPSVRVFSEVARTGWSTVRDQTILGSDGRTIQSLPLRWRDSWRYSLGAEYRPSDGITLRSGLTFDQTPVPEDTRSVRLPANDLLSVGFGARWTLGSLRALDIGIGASRARKAKVKQDDGSPQLNGAVIGDFATRSVLLAVQLTQSF